ncbi:MAG TPA: Gfo/Idh/MocA family oxidoreductase [Candidatus Binatus sp.]|uniref:Gfo/Idh/MocA family protein n=1 Tax=Candidatus Binatus sp. TaxID=2811406 RepID=UPI002B4A1751|nr:Gfo/Idh/MocA family oxidoreductase [Candidatus Binatus sp.]HKN13371.1 Gfo/Idh/MocA family oxidoreductase [Candidatus Binatus sp.]
MIRIAIAGAGAIAERAHIPALRSVADAQIIALQSRTIEKAEHVAGALWPDDASRPKVYSDFDQMPAPARPDAVGVFTPNHLHCEFAVKALSAGAHVLVEKPMAPTAAAARAMVDSAAKARRVLMVAMQRRFGGIERAIKEALASGAIGKPNFIRARLSHGGPDLWAPGQKWFMTALEAGGGAMLDLGVHVADLAIWFMGEIDSVSGQVGVLAKQIDVDDTGAMILHFKSGAIGVVEASWSSMPPLSAIEIYGTKGRVMAGYPRNDISILRDDGSPAPGFSREDVMSRFDPRDLLAPSRALAANFIGAIQGRAKPSPDGNDGLRAVEAVEACYRSSRTGSRIKLPLDS